MAWCSTWSRDCCCEELLCWNSGFSLMWILLRGSTWSSASNDYSSTWSEALFLWLHWLIEAPPEILVAFMYWIHLEPYCEPGSGQGRGQGKVDMQDLVATWMSSYCHWSIVLGSIIKIESQVEYQWFALYMCDQCSTCSQGWKNEGMLKWVGLYGLFVIRAADKLVGADIGTEVGIEAGLWDGTVDIWPIKNEAMSWATPRQKIPSTMHKQNWYPKQNRIRTVLKT